MSNPPSCPPSLPLTAGTLTLARMVVTDIVLPSLPPSSFRVSGHGLEPEGGFYRGAGKVGSEEEKEDPKSVAGRKEGRKGGREGRKRWNRRGVSIIFS